MNINYYSPIGYTGYGVAGLNYLKCLIEKKHEPCLFLIGNQIHADNEADYKLAFDAMQKQESYDKEAPCLKIWHQFDLGARIGTGKYFALPFFELTKLSNKEIHHLNNVDEIIVSSEWAKKVLEQNNVKRKISVVPLGVDQTLFNHTIQSDMKPKDKFIFMNVGKWEVRKGHDILIELFNEAFTKDDNVELWIAASSSELAFPATELQQWHSLYSNGPLKEKIKIFPRLNTQEEVAKLLSYADCGIFPSRAEGWNLELLEMMAMNKPVITTDYSAHTEFCDPKNAFLVDILELEDAYDGKYFFGTGKWAKIDKKQKEQFIDYMRHVYKNQISTNDEGLKTANMFSWSNATDKLLRCISN
jgi:glycosyltransferase involved in cell wall biosynthesis